MQLSNRVKEELTHAASAYKYSNDLVYVGEEFAFKHLKAQEFVSLYRLLLIYHLHEKDCRTPQEWIFNAHLELMESCKGEKGELSFSNQ